MCHCPWRYRERENAGFEAASNAVKGVRISYSSAHVWVEWRMLGCMHSSISAAPSPRNAQMIAHAFPKGRLQLEVTYLWLQANHWEGARGMTDTGAFQL
jgi:hypothetical protein